MPIMNLTVCLKILPALVGYYPTPLLLLPSPSPMVKDVTQLSSSGFNLLDFYVNIVEFFCLHCGTIAEIVDFFKRVAVSTPNSMPCACWKSHVNIKFPGNMSIVW